MERVVYLFGAGFSAPLGLPVMSNFLVKSKDLFFQGNHKFSHFQGVFDTISDLSVIKNYFDADLFNIEEILSILEMQENLEGSTLSNEFTRYISDVINGYTPSITARDSWPANWHDFLFGSNNIWRPYGFLISSLFGLKFQEVVDNNIRTPRFSFLENRDSQYSVVTLNYDRVIESLIDFMVENLVHDEDLQFITNPIRETQIDEIKNKVPLAKLHGSVESEIVPPTWSKMLSDSILAAWKLAFDVISNSNQLRIIGYSLPTVDAYVKYLLKSGVLVSKHLKRIDVICLDRSGSVRSRYDEFIDFNYYRFANADVVEYMKLIEDASNPRGFGRGSVIECDKLEEQHENFMVDRSA